MRALIAGLMLLSPAAAAQQAPPDSVQSDIERLDDPSHTVRSSAMIALLESRETFGFTDAARALSEAGHSPETRARLTRVLYDRFERDPKGGLGVGFGPERLIGVEIRNVVQDPQSFPATALLNEGDVLLVCDGSLLRHSDDLRAHILSHAPGETLELIVERGDERLAISAPLGAYTSLRGAAPVEWDVARQAVAIRLTRIGVEIPNADPVGALLTRDDWVGAAFPDDPQRPPRDRAPGFPNVVHGGSDGVAVSGAGASTRSLMSPWSSRGEAQEFMRGDLIDELMLDLTRVRSDLFARELRLQIVVAELGGDDPAAAALRDEIDALRAESEVLAVRLEEERSPAEP